jgi:hypothetical protein
VNEPSFKTILDVARQIVLTEPDHEWVCEDARKAIAKESTQKGQGLGQGDFIEWVIDIARF